MISLLFTTFFITLLFMVSSELIYETMVKPFCINVANFIKMQS